MNKQKIDDKRIEELSKMIKEYKISYDDIMAVVFENGFTRINDITNDKYDRIYNYLKTLK